MNTSSLHGSVCGRIYLQTRQSIYDTLSTFLLFQLIMAIVFIAIPLLLIIATSDFDLVEAFQDFVISYADGRLLLFYTGGLSLFSMIWINRVVHQVQPTAYTQIPSSTFEKLLLLTELLHLLMPVDGSFIPFDFRGLSLAQICQGLYNTLPGMLFLVFLAALCMMSFRNVFVGFAVLGLILVLIFWGVTIFMLQTAHIYYETPEEFIRGWENAMLVQRIVFLLLDLGLLSGLYYRLHTLQIK